LLIIELISWNRNNLTSESNIILLINPYIPVWYIKAGSSSNGLITDYRVRWQVQCYRSQFRYLWIKSRRS